MAKTQNYTDVQTQRIKELYEAHGNSGIQLIADELEKSPNSVRAKLVREGIYVTPEKPIKARKNGPSKKEIIREFEAFGFSTTALDGLQGATKAALNEVKSYIDKIQNGKE